MLRTHLVINLLFILLFLPSVSDEFIFIFVALLATFLPDIDTGFSTLGKSGGGKLLQFFVRHRGFIHSFTFCIIISIALAAFLPILALPFFLGYSLHLLVDSFTLEGIKPFWPFNASSSWRLRTGSRMETALFVLFLIIDLLVFVFLFKNVF